MLLARCVAGVSAVGLMVLGASVVCGQTTSTGSAQAYPNKPLRLLTGTVGGGNDFMARQIAQGIAGSLGQPVIVDNRGGGITAEMLLKATPDGYTISVSGNNTWTAPLLRKLNYDALRDFIPVTLIARDVNVVVVNSSVPVSSIKELIALARAKPGVLNFASSVIGSPQHIGTEIFKSMAGIDIVGVPYKGVAPAITATLSNEVQILIADPGLVAPHVKSGKLKALAVTSPSPSALAPGLPTVTATGLPGYEWIGMTGVFMPGKTPSVFVNRIHEEVVRFLTRPEVKERFLQAGAEIVASSPEEFATAVKADMTKVAKVVKDTGIKLE